MLNFISIYLVFLENKSVKSRSIQCLVRYDFHVFSRQDSYAYIHIHVHICAYSTVKFIAR